MIDLLKDGLVGTGEWAEWSGTAEGHCGVWCVVQWNESSGYHEIYVYYGG